MSRMTQRGRRGLEITREWKKKSNGRQHKIPRCLLFYSIACIITHLLHHILAAFALGRTKNQSHCFFSFILIHISDFQPKGWGHILHCEGVWVPGSLYSHYIDSEGESGLVGKRKGKGQKENGKGTCGLWQTG